jgi:hypothetical protein
MSGAATSSRGGVELLADDLVDPSAVDRHLEAMRQPSMDESELSIPLSNQSAVDAEYPVDSCCLLQDVAERSRQKSVDGEFPST